MSVQYTRTIFTIKELPLKYDFQEISHEAPFLNLY